MRCGGASGAREEEEDPRAPGRKAAGSRLQASGHRVHVSPGAAAGRGQLRAHGLLQPDAGNASWNGPRPWGRRPPPPTPLQVTLTLVCLAGLLMLFTVFGNVLVIIAAHKPRAQGAPESLPGVSGLLADILVATLVIPFSLANEVMGYWYFGKAWCEIYLAPTCSSARLP